MWSSRWSHRSELTGADDHEEPGPEPGAAQHARAWQRDRRQTAATPTNTADRCCCSRGAPAATPGAGGRAGPMETEGRVGSPDHVVAVPASTIERAADAVRRPRRARSARAPPRPRWLPRPPPALPLLRPDGPRAPCDGATRRRRASSARSSGTASAERPVGPRHRHDHEARRRGSRRSRTCRSWRPPTRTGRGRCGCARR